MYTIFGKLIFESTPSNLSSEIDMTSFSKGVYLLKIHSDNSLSTKKNIEDISLKELNEVSFMKRTDYRKRAKYRIWV